MTEHNASRRQVERAIDELTRGRAVRLSGAGGNLTLQAAESLEKPVASGRVVLSAERARFLGIAAKSPVSLSLKGLNAKTLSHLVHGASPIKKPAARDATPLEQSALALIRLAGFLPAAAVGVPAKEALSVSAQAVAAYAKKSTQKLTVLPEAKLPLAGAEGARVIPFREADGKTHLAVIIGRTGATPLARVHSSCVTGDILGSLRCDCGNQLHAAIRAMHAEGAGVLLYLNQEGRGIGLANKLRAYALQDAGLDTVDANHALGFADDERDFRLAAAMLNALKIKAVRLLTNNPAKVKALSGEGIRVAERVALKIKPQSHNKAYLAAKTKRLGHLD